MQKPDANGYVTLTWPSKNIPHGGIFHTRQVEPTAQRREFLKVLLEESRMDIQQRKKKNYMLRQEEEKKPEPEIQQPLMRPRTSKRRSLSAIRESGIFDDEPYKPLKRGEDREKLKEKLADIMAYGERPEQLPSPSPPQQRIPKPKSQLPTNKEKWDDLLTQIRERAEWLEDMEALGQADPHREIIKDQIAKRLRAMDALGIDSQCSTERSGFSTMRSREPNIKSNRSRQSNSSTQSKKSGKSAKLRDTEEATKSAGSQNKQKSNQSSAKNYNKNKEENVDSYECSLKYSPRRRV